MKTSSLLKDLTSAAALLGLVPVAAYATVTITLTGGVMADSSGTPLADGRLLQLIASPADLTFSAPTETDFVSDDDIVLATFQVDSLTTGAAGTILTDLYISFEDHPTLVEGAPLLLRWYDIPFASSSPGENASYGQFRTDSIVDTSTFAWYMPADGSSTGLNFVTQSVGGSQAETDGEATQVAVPEPASVGLGFAAVSGLLVSIRRRRRSGMSVA